MLNPRVISEYLAKPRENYDWLKASSTEELDQALGEALQVPRGYLNLWRHQKVALLLLAELKRFLLFIDMGGGKTLTTLALIQALKNQGVPAKAIVFVPYVTSVMTWVDECEKHTPNLKCVPLVWDTSENLKRLLCTEADLTVICYQSAVAMLSNREGKKWRLNIDQIKEVFSTFNVAVWDEVHKCKDVNSLTYRMCKVISGRCEYAFGLTGTPFGRDLQDLWPQFYLIDHGETLGPTLGFYREVFFTQKRRYFGGYDYSFRKRLLPDLKRIIRNRSLHYAIEDLIELPDREYIKRNIRWPEAAKGYIDRAITDLRRAAHEKDASLIENNYLRLRQLSSGFMTIPGDESRVEIAFEDNPKLDVLTELVEALPPGCKMVIFHHFIYSNGLISKRLSQLGIDHARVWGGQSKNLSELERFKNDGTCTVLVINSRSGSSSLNLQFANYCVFFEQPDSPIDRQQAERRVWRPGQQRRVIYYDLFVEGTVDEKMAEANLAGKNLLKELLQGGKF